MTPIPMSRLDLSPLIHPRERIYFALAGAIGGLAYATLFFLAYTNDQLRPTLVFYGIIVVLFSVATHGFMLGHIKGNAVRTSVRQFTTLHTTVAEFAGTLGMSEVPDVYVMQSGGVLNAFATRFLMRNFVVLNSDVLAMADQQGASAVRFVVAHELGHLRRGHLKYRWLLAPARIVPFLGGAYSRACEYTCDRFGAACAPEGAMPGLLALAAGPHLYRQVEPRLYAAQVETDGGFWVSAAEIFASHPHLSKRVGALLQRGQTVPTYSPVRELDSSEAAVAMPESR